MGWGLALSGGGAKGAAHVGALKALVEAGLWPDMVGGTSAGSIVAGMMAAGAGVPELEDALQRMQSRGNYWLDPNWRGAIGAGLSLLTRRPIALGGLLRGDRLERFFRKETCGKLLSESQMPLCLTAVDINRARLVLFASREIEGAREHADILTHPAIYEGIRASTAIPGVFEPLMTEGMRLVDGGVWESMPVFPLYAMGAARVVAVNVGYSGEDKPKVDNIFEIVMQSIDVMGYALALCRSRAADVRVDVPTEDIGVFSFDKLDVAMERGYRVMRAALPRVRRALTNCAPRPPRPRLHAVEPTDQTRAG